MLIDTHAHLNFKAYDQDLKQVIERCQKKGMAIINVGAQYKTSQLAVKLALENKNFYAAVGLHPIHVFDEEFKEKDYQALINDKVVAIGETGLDFFHPTFERTGAETLSLEEIISRQRTIFLKHLKLAKENNLPLILHARNGIEGRNVYLEILEILKSEKIEQAVFHCFGGDLKIAQTIINQGFYLGFDGPITFKKKAEELQAMVKEIPLEKILIETDCPYLAPEPHRGQRNEPIYVEYVAEKIAELKNLSKSDVIKQVWENAMDLFKIR